MPQVAEIRLSNILLLRLRRFRVPKQMKQVLVLTLQILFSSHKHRRLLIYFIIIFCFGWFRIGPSGQVEVQRHLSWPDFLVLWVWPLECAAFGISPTLESLPFVCMFQGLWIAPKNVRFLFYAVMSACHILYLLGSKMWKLKGKHNISEPHYSGIYYP